MQRRGVRGSWEHLLCDPHLLLRPRYSLPLRTLYRGQMLVSLSVLDLYLVPLLPNLLDPCSS